MIQIASPPDLTPERLFPALARATQRCRERGPEDAEFDITDDAFFPEKNGEKTDPSLKKLAKYRAEGVQ